MTLAQALGGAALFAAGVVACRIWEHERDLWHRAHRQPPPRFSNVVTTPPLEPDAQDVFGSPYAALSDASEALTSTIPVAPPRWPQRDPREALR